MASFAKTDLIVLDDWGLVRLDAGARRDLLELRDDRHGQRSTRVTSQRPIVHSLGRGFALRVCSRRVVGISEGIRVSSTGRAWVSR